MPTTEAQRIVGDARLLEDLVDEGVLSSGTTHDASGPVAGSMSTRGVHVRPRSLDVGSAGAILVILPTLVVFLFLQRFIYNGFTRGATK